MSNLTLSSPCAADWATMSPAAAGRHCAACDKDVVDLTCLAPAARDSALKRLELAVTVGRKICVRAPVRADGRLVGGSLQRRVLTGGVATILAMTVAGCQGDGLDAASTASAPRPQQNHAEPAHQTQATPGVKPVSSQVLIDKPPAPAPPPPAVVNPIRMGRIARVDPIEPPVIQPDAQTSVKMGEMCLPPEPPAPSILLEKK